MNKFFLGRSPFTTIAGYIMAVLTAIHQITITGPHRWQDYLLPVAIAVFGRLAADDHKDQDQPPLAPAVSETDNAAMPDNFIKRGKSRVQRRNSKGQFVGT